MSRATQVAYPLDAEHEQQARMLIKQAEANLAHVPECVLAIKEHEDVPRVVWFRVAELAVAAGWEAVIGIETIVIRRPDPAAISRSGTHRIRSKASVDPT